MRQTSIDRTAASAVNRAITAGVAGTDTWYESVEYANTNEAFFRKHLELPSGIPSHDTFNRVFAIMDTRILEKNYQQ